VIHRYTPRVRWTGDLGSGTSSFRGYARDHEVLGDGKPSIAGSSDPGFRGDAERWNPEELLVASLSQCHMLWYLHLCSVSGVVVTAYEDRPVGVMEEDADGGGRFVEVVLHPAVVVAEAAMLERAGELHAGAHAKCFIASSVAFPVRHEPDVTAYESPGTGAPAGTPRSR
jgi:organic hydroperoxide reductase OsmC/OhrA